MNTLVSERHIPSPATTVNIDLTVVIPAHQEAGRIERTLERLTSFLSGLKESSEIIVVCNACTDETVEIVETFAKTNNAAIRVLETSSAGKGLAVRQGVLASVGQTVFFTDADLAYEPELIPTFLKALETADLVLARRDKSITYESLTRRVVGGCAGWLLSTFFTNGISDTQAGFKAFDGLKGRKIFAEMSTKGFAFDIELIMRAQRADLRIKSLVVPWIDVPGTTVRPLADSMLALLSLATIACKLFLKFK